MNDNKITSEIRMLLVGLFIGLFIGANLGLIIAGMLLEAKQQNDIMTWEQDALSHTSASRHMPE